MYAFEHGVGDVPASQTASDNAGKGVSSPLDRRFSSALYPVRRRYRELSVERRRCPWQMSRPHSRWIRDRGDRGIGGLETLQYWRSGMEKAGLTLWLDCHGRAAGGRGDDEENEEKVVGGWQQYEEKKRK